MKAAGLTGRCRPRESRAAAVRQKRPHTTTGQAHYMFDFPQGFD